MSAGKIIVILVLMAATFYFAFQDPEITGNIVQESKNLKVASWDLELYGPEKTNNVHIIEEIVKVIKGYDVIIIQGIRDPSQTAFENICAKLPAYQCYTSTFRGGSENYQYGVIYKDVIIGFDNLKQAESVKFTNAPLLIKIKKEEYLLTVYTFEAKNTRVRDELKALEGIVDINGGNTAVIGNMYADCEYYQGEFKDFDKWNWIISDHEDTLTAPQSCAYDRIFLNQDALAEFASFHIDKTINPEVSGHYLISFTQKTQENK
ncbi:hypothetical protein GOV10_01550 [Candidatus Woesearchaeota archaeon]|nr:hypothetical protein [Candidatus Woesearchaeota archaeon]